MRITIALAALLVVGAAAAGAGALSQVPFQGNPANQTMLGSDTLLSITRDLIDDSTPLSIVYDGLGSLHGEVALIESGVAQVATPPGNPKQTVAPMDRPLSGDGVCTAVPAYRTKAEGVAFALDAVSIVTSQSNGCSAAPTPGSECSPNPSGLRYSGTVGGETIDDWKEVLKLVYFGLTNTGTSGLARNCNSAVRRALLDNWSNLFQSSCANCTDSTQGGPGLRHAFRRDEESGTTAIFAELIGAPPIGFTTGSGYVRSTASSYFCNVAQSDAAAQGMTASSYPTRTRTAWQGGTATLPNVAPYFPEYQDHDPIRRPCAGAFTWTGSAGPLAGEGAEEVCGPKGDLGVVLAIQPPPVDAETSPTPYPTAYCEKGRFRYAPAPRTALQNLRCPNGQSPDGGFCLYPVSSTNNFACINAKDNIPRDPAGAASLALVPYPPNGSGRTPCDTTNPDPSCPSNGYPSDGRVYNRYLLRGTFVEGVPPGSQATTNGFQTVRRPNSTLTGTTAASILGAYYRIHTTRTLVSPFTSGTCTRASATAQIGCLTTASPCSVGYAGAESVDANPGSIALRVNQTAPAEACVQNFQSGSANAYPLAHYLYVNSYRGFENLLAAAPFNETSAATDAELNLVRRFVTAPQSKLRDYGLTPLVSGPFCKDFDETVCPGVTTNTNACLGNPDGIPSGPGFEPHP